MLYYTVALPRKRESFVRITRSPREERMCVVCEIHGRLRSEMPASRVV